MRKTLPYALALTLFTTGFAFAEGSKNAPEEVPVRPALDKNGDGKITKDEVRAHADARFERMDSNKDGVVDERDARGSKGSQDERNSERREGKGADGHRGRGPHHHHAAHRGGLVHLLKTADVDQDGKLSAKEAEAFGKARFAKLDLNQDGFLTRDELRPKKHHGRDKK